MAFQVGQKVVCIAECEVTRYMETPPVVGSVYTIREIGEHEGIAWVRLVEIVNKPMQYWGIFAEKPWEADCFRPLVDRKTDISIFTEMLHKEPATC